MNKYTKFLALMSFALVMSACQDDNIISVAPALPGDDIVFGATGYLESGDKGTRTIYGDVYEDLYGKHIQVKWVKGTDRMDIACPQSATAGNVKIVEYKVMDESNSVVKDTLDLDEKIDSIRIEDSSVTATLHRVGNAGLQWSAEDTHHFFASYPSKAMIAEKLATTLSQTEIQQLGMTLDGEQNAKLRGYLPVDQTPKVLPTKTTQRVEGEGEDAKTKTGWVIEPDMTYAYMVANETVDTKGNVGLQFTSQMTALEFEIVASDIAQDPENTNPTPHTIKILGVTLSHANNEQIAGHFEYDYAEDFFNNVVIENAVEPTYVTQSFPEGLLVDPTTGFVDVTFFVFPGVTFNDGNDDAAEDKLTKDLELTVLYQIDGIPQNRTAKIRKQIEPKKKYFFANVQLPQIPANGVSTSNWFNALDGKILLSQISIPVASNVFAHADYGFEAKSIQQVQTYTDLWDRGVRGFEFVTRRAVTGSEGNYDTDNTWSLSTAHFVCDEVPHETDKMNFGIAFETLITKLKDNPKETLVLICTYQAVGDGYDPNGYVQQLLNYFDVLVDNKTVKQDDFVQLHANSTVEDIRGKICVIIRPGDDDRYQTNAYTSGIALSSNNGKNTDWSGNLLLIQDWGTAFDVWDRRYEGVAREAQFDISYREPAKNLAPRPFVENLLWGASTSSSAYTQPTDKNGNTSGNNNNFNNFGNNLTKKTQFNYEHTLSDGGTAYVQEWARVVPSSMAKKIYTVRSDYYLDYYMWVQWPESYSEKLAAIDGLFEKSVATKGISNISSLYINSLSGYYVTETYKEGLYPFLDKYSYEYPYTVFGYSGWSPGTFSLSNMGKGGDHPGLAYDLNKYVYGILSGKDKMQNGSKLPVGPWGLVMMEHIGNTAKGEDDKSLDLVNLIVLNNFKFPLAKGEGSGGGNGSTKEDLEI